MSRPIIAGEGGVVELRTFTAGTTPGLELRLACEVEKRDPSSGGWTKDTPVYVTVVVWGEQAKNLYASVDKGDLVTFSGELEQRTWDSEDGKHHVKDQIRATSVGVAVRFDHAPTKRKRADVSPKGTAAEEEPPF